MKAFVIISASLALLALLCGLFAETPSGESATHQLFVAGFMALFTVGCEIERRKDARR